MEKLLEKLRELKTDLVLLFSKYDKGEDVEETLKKIKPIIRHFYETEPE